MDVLVTQTDYMNCLAMYWTIYFLLLILCLVYYWNYLIFRYWFPFSSFARIAYLPYWYIILCPIMYRSRGTQVCISFFFVDNVKLLSLRLCYIIKTVHWSRTLFLSAYLLDSQYIITHSLNLIDYSYHRYWVWHGGLVVVWNCNSPSIITWPEARNL